MPHVLLPLLLCALVLFPTLVMHAMALHLHLLHERFSYRTSGWRPLLQDMGELSDAEAERRIQNLLPESRPLGALLLRLRPSRQLRDLQPIASLF